MNVFTVLLLFFSGTTECARILCVFPYPSYSHQIVFQEIWKELSFRGHQVTVITPHPLNDPSLSNLTEINVDLVYDVLKEKAPQKRYSKELDPTDIIKNLRSITETLTERVLSFSKVNQLISNQKDVFDLVFLQYSNPAWCALSEIYNAPVIYIFTMNLFSTWYDTIGNPNHPILYPEAFFKFIPGEQTLGQKFQTVYTFLWSKLYDRYVTEPGADEIAQKFFGNTIPYIGKLRKDAKIFFINRNTILHPPRPNLPAVLDTSSVHIKPPKSLPEDLRQILEESKNGVIYISFGSNVKSTNLEVDFRSNMLQALSELPFTVLWKWESDFLPNKPKNVIIRKWLPQSDLLAHPKVKVFVTHGGQQSVEEAIAREVPMVCIPFYLDQQTHARRIRELQIGIEIDPNSLTKNNFKDAVLEVTKKKYKHEIKEIHKKFFDKPISGLNSIIWWSEYVIRHKKTKHLRSFRVDVTLSEYLLLDIIAISAFVLLVFIYLLLELCSKIFNFFKQKYPANTKSTKQR